jgi:glycosyltransferase involved in cell wall biosynthesis
MNRGLIFSLNRAIDFSQGKWIARMDADDISLPERLEKQVSMLLRNPKIGILACPVIFIDENKNQIGFWQIDQITLNHHQIKNAMPRENCIAHPTIIGKKDIFLKYRYNSEQAKIEDYDLWLRLLSEGVKFSKIAESMLLYRIHSKSVTQTSKKAKEPVARVFRCKLKYLMKEASKFHFTLFNFKVFYFMVIDVIIMIKKTAF